MRCKVIYEDDYLIVILKPAGLATQTAKVGEADVVSELKKYLRRDKEPYLGVVHRLDQPVEGLLVFAKDKKTAADLTKQLGQGTLNKQYYAVVCGKPKTSEGELVDYLYKDANGKAAVTDAEGGLEKGAKKAVLQYRVVREMESRPPIYLMDIHIDTGRFHQIRAQMSHAGMPLLGDKKYGTEDSIALSSQRQVRTVALFAYSVAFVHPRSGKNMQYTVMPTEHPFQ
ncbi:MAG: RluA family pseudouridine synthase [Acetatifactor sp.]|nr:RluA family pseudouridine synthase [Acetatifactor sp.]